MFDLVNEFRRETLDLPVLHTRQALRMMIDERVPHTYCWSPSMVPRPTDWPAHIDLAGFFFLDVDVDHYQPNDALTQFLGLNNDQHTSERLPPPMYIGFGSITGNDSHRLLQIIVAALTTTGYRALIAGFDDENDEGLPPNLLKIGDVPHGWLFQQGERMLNRESISLDDRPSSVRCLSPWRGRYHCRWLAGWETDDYCSFLR